MTEKDAKPDAAEATHWSLDKRVPIALIIAVLTSSAGLAGQAMLMNHRVGALERSIERIEGRLTTSDAARIAADREVAQRDAQVREALANLNGATTALRDVVGDLRIAVRTLETRSVSPQPPRGQY